MPKILIVDDASFIRHILGDIISKAGFGETFFAEDGLQAIEKANELKPDIITLDISMPNIDGLDAIKQILEVSPLSKIIMISAVTGFSIIQEALDNGAIDFIKKPFNKTEIEEKINLYL